MSLSKKSPIIIEYLRKRKMLDLLNNKKRLDGRNLDDLRTLEIDSRCNQKGKRICSGKIRKF